MLQGIEVKNIALSTKCESNTNRGEAMHCDDGDWCVRGRGNWALEKKPLAGGRQTRGSSVLPDGQRGQQHLILGGVEAQGGRNNFSLGTRPKDSDGQ